MLKHLSIKNYAIIDTLDIDFDPHLNIITGETGAGKSIILGALNMILGKRADTSVLRDESTKAIIEGTFEVGHLNLKNLFAASDLEYETETIIRREIRPNGKSRAFVNDSPVTLDQLKTLTVQLVDLHTQQDSSAILDKRFYTSILDRLANQSEKVETFSSTYRVFRQKEQQLKESRERINTQKTDLDYLAFQYTELSELNLDLTDGEALEDELALLENAGEVIENLQHANNLLQDGELNVSEMLHEAGDRIERLSSINMALKQLSDRLQQVLLEISDIASTANQIADETDIDEQRLLELRARQTSINRLLQKHRLNDVRSLMVLQDDLQQRLQTLKVSDEDLAAMETKVGEMKKALWKDAKSISSKRKKKVQDFEREVTAILHAVGMPYARIKLQQSNLEDGSLNNNGMDLFELYFSANKGVDLQSLKQVVSGGERSRLMLSVKSLIAQHMQLSTMIFDEIDTGISGEVASRVGEIFKRMSTGHQIISITHLPQIAAQANRHLFVYKDDSQPVTVARIKVLNETEKILEIAKMLSGDQPGEAALLTATELIGPSLN